MTSTLRLPLLAACAVAAAALTLTPAVLAQSNGAPERFTAFAVNTSNIGRTGGQTIEIAIDRWTSDAERDKLLDTLMNKGSDALLDALRDAPVVGHIRPTTGLGYDLHYARRVPLPEGGERVVVATDRPIGFWEASNQPRSIDYPFTVVELHVNKDGKGEGKLSVATKIVGDAENKIIVLENYATQPVMLNNVTRERGSD